MNNIFLESAIIIFVYQTFFFSLSQKLKRNDIADIAWGGGYLLLVFYYTLFSENLFAREILVNILVAFWAVRLMLHIYFRNKGKPEDFRYKKMREDFGDKFFIKSFLKVFMLQGAFLLLVISPVTFINNSQGSSLNFIDFIGVFIWIVGFYFETVGDYQLMKFKKSKENKGKIMKDGLWKFTRHPNYFGEVIMWWGIFLISLSSENFWFALIGPLTITVLILFVSGVPMLEKKYEGNAEFEKYKKQTNKFFPWFPRG